MEFPKFMSFLSGKPKKLKGRWEKYYTEEEKNATVPDITMYERIKKSAEDFSEYTAYNYFGTIKTFPEFLNQIDKCASALYELGVRKSDIVTICMPNTPEALIMVYGLNRIGAVASMVHPLSGENEIKNYINEGESEYLLVIDMLYEKIKNIISDTKLRKVIVVSASDSFPWYLKIGYNLTKKRKYPKVKYDRTFISWKKFIKNYYVNRDLPDFNLNKDTPAVILHSGGTTGKPKGIVLANSNFEADVVQGRIFLKRLRVGDKCLSIMPIFHGFGLSVTMHTAYALGVQTILMPQFDSKKFDVLLDKHKPNVVMGVPTLFEALTNSNNVNDLDLSCIKYIVVGGDILNPNLEDKINAFLKEHGCDIEIARGYGMTEATAAVSCDYKEVHKRGSVGIPFAMNYIKIIDQATRKEVKPNEKGEICISGPVVMMGYLNNPEETNAMLQIHDDGHVWLHTGDMGHMDEDGFLFYDQRIKRMIISSGYNVYPQQVEEVIEKHPAVMQCTVVGVPHKYKMEVAKAFIVLNDGYNPSIFTKNDIKEYCKKNLAHYECPYKYVYRKSLPKTLLGKIDFKKLQADEDGDDEY